MISHTHTRTDTKMTENISKLIPDGIYGEQIDISLRHELIKHTSSIVEAAVHAQFKSHPQKYIEALTSVQEPDLKKNIVELNLVEDVVCEEGLLTFLVKVHNPAMHSRKKMEEA